MNNDILNIEIAKSPKRLLTILSVETKPVTLKDGTSSEKLVFKTIEEASGRLFDISDAWVEGGRGDAPKVAGIWVSVVGGEIPKSSTLAKILKFNGCQKLSELIGKEVIAYPDRQDYLVLTTFNM